MLTKRMMLGAGALALALVVAACSKDGAGGATGVSETANGSPSVPRVNPPAPAVITTPATPEAVAAGGSVGGAAGVISSSLYGGHQVVLAEVTASGGATLMRVTLDGVRIAEFSGVPGEEAAQTDATVYADGQVLLHEMFNATDAGSVVIPQQYLGLTARPSGGPQLQAAFPCGTEIAVFGGASLWLSAALMWAKVQPFNFAAWVDLRLAISAVAVASYNLYVCLKRAW